MSVTVGGDETAGTSSSHATTQTTVRATWRGGRKFEVGGSSGATIVIDGDRVAGTGPVDTLLGALAACAGPEIIDYLAKRRTPVASLDIVIDAERRGSAPRRVLGARLEIRIDGAGIDAEHASRAIDLAFRKYCSVSASLAPDVLIDTQLVLNGESHEVHRVHAHSEVGNDND
ncbi:MAG TPA: OsmC family protein [Gemmatimonadaceae bacterium]